MSEPNQIEPRYYRGDDIQLIDVIEEFDLNFYEGTALQYIVRCRLKNPDNPAEDIKKAQWYLERYIQKLEREE